MSQAWMARRVGGIMIAGAALLANDKASSDWFGYSVALSGDTAVIGARLEDDSGANGNGAAYVFLDIARPRRRSRRRRPWASGR